MAGRVPAIHEFPCTMGSKTWMPGIIRLVLGPAEPDPSAGHDDVRGYSAASAIRFGS